MREKFMEITNGAFCLALFLLLENTFFGREMEP